MAAIVGDVYQLKTYCKNAAQLGMNIFHFQVTAMAGLGAPDSEVAHDWDAFIGPRMKSIIGSDSLYAGASAQLITGALPLPIIRYDATTSGAGTFGTSVLPRQVTGITTWRTAFAGRHGRGRTYWPFPDRTAEETDGTPKADYIDAVEAVAVALIGGFAATDGAGNNTTLRLCVWDRTALHATQVSGSTTRDRFATQRRRGDYGAPNSLPF